MTAHVITHDAVIDKRYKLMNRLGRTGMAEVWKAVDQRTGRPVAVKFLVLSDEYLDHSESAEIQAEAGRRFHQEAGLLGKFDHPGIPKLYGEGSYRNVSFIVMEFIDGVALSDLHVKHRPLPLGAIASITVRVAQTLSHAHGCPVVHRDLKPQNIMLANDGIPKLIDFGIAKNLSAGATIHTRPGATLGSIGYQAPEQIGGYPVTPATDVYALGCVLYELIACCPPFPGREVAEIQRMHLYNTPCPLSARTPRVTPELDDLILRMLEKDAEPRPHLAQVVEAFQPHLPRHGDPAPTPRLDPDPTLPDRDPTFEHRVSRLDESVDAPMPKRRPSAWLSVREVEAACDEAEQELASGTPGPAMQHLIALAPRARKDLGAAKPVVQRAEQLLAEGLRRLDDQI